MEVGLNVAKREILTDCGKRWDRLSSETSDEKRKAAERLNAVASYITLSSVVYYVGAVLVLHVVRTDFDPSVASRK